jgi:Ca2+-binding RTX toxin-like protein
MAHRPASVRRPACHSAASTDQTIQAFEEATDMPTYRVKHDSNKELTIDTTHSTWIIEAGVTLAVKDQPAVFFDIGDANTLHIFGDVVGKGEKGVGLTSYGEDARVTVEKGGSISGVYGIVDYRSGNHYVNDGSIEAKDTGFSSTGTVHFVNSGTLKASVGNAFVDVAGSTIVNKAGGVIQGAHFGLEFTGSGTTKIVNDGSIIGQTALDDNNDGRLRVINHGKITGDVYLGLGNDVLDTRTGSVHGSIDGSGGNDTFLVSSQKVDIVESAGGGNDTVKSTVSYSLGDNIETLILLGKGNTSGQGNGSDNHITGNSGNNTLHGGAGLDFLNGGKGNDTLAGGADQDNFVFVKGDGVDTVTDFVHGSDYVDILKFSGITDYSSLQSHISQHGSDTWITLGDGDKLILHAIDSTTLTADDFVFS